MRKIFLLICFLNLITKGKSQQLVQERLYKIGNTNRSFGFSTITRDGNIVITGNYIASPDNQTVLALVNPACDALWMREGPSSSVGGAVRQAPGSGFTYYTTKRYTSPTASGTILQKYNRHGLLEWTKPYATNYFDMGYLLLSAPDSGYYLGGQNSIGNKVSSFTLSRTDSLGNLKWREGYDWGGDFLADIQHTSNGNIVMYGITYSSVVNAQRLKLLLVNQNGDSVLGRQLNVTGNPNRKERLNSSSSSVSPLSDGGFLIAAEIDTSVTNASPYLGMVVKVDANLLPVWHYINRSLPNNIIFTRSRELTDGTVVMLGHERKGTLGNGGDKFFLYHFSGSGNLLNIYTFASSLASQIRVTTLEALPDSSFIIGGSGLITPAPNLSSGFYVAKVKIAGLPPALPLPGPVKVTGTKEETLLAGTTLGQSYPNPITSEATIPYTLPKNYSQANITIREIATGRELRKYELKRNSNSLTVDVSHLSNGLYLYSLEVDEKPVATRKLAVMK